MEHELNEKYLKLKNEIKGYDSVSIAFSGGVDSSFLAFTAYNVLLDKSLAITINSEAYPPDSIDECRNIAAFIGIRLIVIEKKVCDIPEFSSNSPERCYYCKKKLFSEMLKISEKENIKVLIDGTNADDTNDYRPGVKALEELGIKSPLKILGFTKNEIRIISREYGLPTWNRQSYACLASRFPYGTVITPELLEKTWRAENILKNSGIKYYRVRNHGDIARIEISPDDFNILLDKQIRINIVKQIKELGFKYIALDLQGYRTGSMNEVL
jgi:pyridinium-3,5-biscarboxylic acid mononucleotide sulfurtransferase